MTPRPSADLSIRPFEREDEEEALRLLRTCLPGWRVPEAYERFRWKHEESPFGPSRRGVVELDGDLVAFYATMPWDLVLDGRVLSAGRGTDWAVRPDLQRSGIGQEVLGKEYQGPQWPGQAVQLTHGNELSAGKRRKFGLPESTNPVTHLAPLRPGRLLRWRLGRTPPPARRQPFAPMGDVLEECGEALTGLLSRAQPPGRLVTARSPEYLEWRYARCPGRRYVASALWDGGALRGLLIGRLVESQAAGEPSHFEVSELIVAPGDQAATWRLLRRVWSVDAAYAVVVLPTSPRRRWDPLRGGFPVVRQRGWTFNARSVAAGLPEDLSDTRRWVLPLGDLEAF